MPRVISSTNNLKRIRHNLMRIYYRLHYYPTKYLEDTDRPLIESLSIPNIIHQSWVTKKLGRKHAHLIDAIRARNESYSFRIYDDGGADQYMSENCHNNDLYEIYQSLPMGPARIDIFRYWIIFDQGGWWLDIKSEIKVPINQLAPPDSTSYIFHENNDLFILPDERIYKSLKHPNKAIANYCFGFRARHPFLKLLTESIVTHYNEGFKFNNFKSRVLAHTGPGLFTKTVHKYIYHNYNTEKLYLDDIDGDGRIEYLSPNAGCRYVARKSYSIT
ncbi:MAG: glycosyltransferase [Candidatus Sedimenticola endophacoides]